MKALWAYIKDKGLQDPADGRRALLDERLQRLLGAETTSVLGLNKLVSPHLTKG